ncbi:MAG: Rieske 2Fe-2S domain-containing protein [Candidatus Poribacteria bacterium]|nr:Rieske 2Fe-2S domain-containing protein [Candidatus Poribacteria bacterium]MDE0502939.1 Rieske 2Fe-2S domain-containing protein [Candidatus Poribacteria bacterium]
MPNYETLAKASDIRPGRGKAFTFHGRRIAVFNDDGEFCALSNVCAHAMGSLARGRVKNGVVTCPVHGYAYDAKTGACQTDARLRVQAYEVMVEDGEVKILQ